MSANYNIDILKNALLVKSGLQLTNMKSCEQLSIDVFLKTDKYVSTITIMQIFGISQAERPINEKILGFLICYAELP